MRLRDLLRHSLVWLRLIRQPDLLGRCVPLHPTPADLRPGELYLVGTPTRWKWVCLRCPDACGALLQLSLNPRGRPCWTASLDWLGRPTVHPSIHQLDGCRSHFWIHRGRIVWCPEAGGP